LAIQTEHRWPCDKCGADLRFAPGQSELVCANCGNVQAIPAATDRKRARSFVEHDVAQGLRDDLPDTASEEVRTTHCPSCGGVVEFQGANHAMECPFCATPVVVDTGTQRLIKPQGVVPFQLTENQARSALISWMGSLWFAPNTLLEYARKGRAMNGIYVPFWTFDAATSSSYRGARGDDYTETRTVTRNGKQETEQVTRTSWTNVSGHVARDFDDVMVMASTTLPQQLGDELTPWDLSQMEPYSADFLAGFQAEGYTVALADGHATGHDKMSAVIRRDVESDIGGDKQRVDNVDTDWRDETFKHILLPIWMAAYKYNDKSYRFLVNGQTGEVQGERPYSWWKIGFAVLAVVVLVAGAVYLHDPGTFGLPTPAWLQNLR
jgi:predicted RNA-binding Zn-ribbon protein involved in translation (DUF1610 family)